MDLDLDGGLIDVPGAAGLAPAFGAQALRGTLGRKVVRRRSRYLNNRLEQDHRGVKQRYYPMRGFGNFEAASRFCTAQEELRDYFRSRRTLGEAVSLAERRRLFHDR